MIETAPQLIYLALVTLGLGFAIAKHGQPRGPVNALDTLFGTAIALAILGWGGFFDPLTR